MWIYSSYSHVIKSHEFDILNVTTKMQGIFKDYKCMISIGFRLFGRKTFSSFSDVCFAVKPRSTENICSLTGKSLSKIWKTVYGKIFRKPFSKIRFSSLSTHFTLTQSLLSLFLTVYFILFTVPSH